MENVYENSTVVSVLGATRRSVLTDESTSMPRRVEGITSWATYRTQATGKEHHIVKITEDPDVSGALSPFDRPGLGPYLRNREGSTVKRTAIAKGADVRPVSWFLIGAGHEELGRCPVRASEIL
jgi:hypothetical protein